MQIINAILDLIEVLNCKIISPLPETIEIFASIVNSTETSFDHFDFYVAATLLSHDIDSLITNSEKDFKKIANFNAFNPL